MEINTIHQANTITKSIENNTFTRFKLVCSTLITVHIYAYMCSVSFIMQMNQLKTLKEREYCSRPNSANTPRTVSYGATWARLARRQAEHYIVI